MRSRCSSSGRKSRASACPSTRKPARWWCRSARGWTGCRWPSSSPPPGCARCRFGALHDRLDQRFRLLTGGSRTALGRQQTLEATVDWSYSLLNGAEQLLLRRLSVFAEGFDLEAAEAVCGFGDIEALEVTDLLGSLVDKSLVVAEPSGGALRYRLLETIRQFAAERLAEAGADEAAAVAAAHSEYFLAVAETAAPHLNGPDQGEWFARLDAEQANLRRAAEHAAGRPDGTTQVLRFGAALRCVLDDALSQ